VNSKRRQREAAHRRATALAGGSPCLSCGRPAPSLPAHYPRHRGMGGGHAGWDFEEWLPLCFNCHEALDGRNGLSEEASLTSEHVRYVCGLRAPFWWASQRLKEGP